jgi:uracil-DNA glycosylase
VNADQQRRAAFLQEIGIGPLWLRRDRSTAGEPEMAAAPAAMRKVGVDADPETENETHTKTHTEVDTEMIGSMDWTQLQAAVASCTRCGLCRSRNRTVFGSGDPHAKWLFVGEGPGHQEDMQGEAFVGPAGKLLDNMLRAIGLQRDSNVFLANVVKCRPIAADGSDRPPSAVETAACMPYLQRQIALIQPTIIVALGKTAALSLLQLDAATPVAKLRGIVHQHAGVPLVVTYHPAYLLRNLPAKSKAWADLCLALESYARAGR